MEGGYVSASDHFFFYFFWALTDKQDSLSTSPRKVTS